MLRQERSLYLEERGDGFLNFWLLHSVISSVYFSESLRTIVPLKLGCTLFILEENQGVTLVVVFEQKLFSNVTTVYDCLLLSYKSP